MALSKNHDAGKTFSATVETDIACLFFENDVLLVTMKEDCSVTVKDMEYLLKTAVSLTRFKKYYAVIDARTNASISSDVSEYYSKSEYSRYRLADAFIINSLAMRLLVNFYISFNKPEILTKTFADADPAIQWINHLKKTMV